MNAASTDTNDPGKRRAAALSVLAAAALVALKLGTGIITGSLGLISAGIESSGDVVAAILTLFAIRVGGRPADSQHQYGHRRAENLAALGEAAILLGGGLLIVYEALVRIVNGAHGLQPHFYVFVVIGLALAVDVSRTLASVRSAAKYGSAALRSNAFHFGADMAGSVAVLGGLCAAAAGFPAGDTIASLTVAAIIFAGASRLILENTRALMDAAPPGAYKRATQAIEGLGDGVELRRLRLRESGGQIFADAVVAVAPGEALASSHGTADDVEAAVHRALPDSDVVVHLEPRADGLALREQALSVALSEPLVAEAHDIVIYEHQGVRSVSLHLKFSREMPLLHAHEVAERVECALRQVPGVEHVQTHLEPLERPLVVLGELNQDGDGPDGAQCRRIRALVRSRTGEPARELQLFHTDAGLVAFVTVAAPGMGLSEAHELATALKDDIREKHPQLLDVVIHTEP